MSTSVASSRASAAPRTAVVSTAPPTNSSVKSNTSVKMAGPDGDNDASATSAPADASPSVSASVPSPTATKTAAGGEQPLPPDSQSSQSSAALTSASSASASASRPSSVSSAVSTPSSVSPSISTPQSVPTGPSRPAEPDTPSDAPSSSKPIQGVSSSSIPYTTSLSHEHTRSLPGIPVPVPEPTSISVAPSTRSTDVAVSAPSTRIVVVRPPAATVAPSPSQLLTTPLAQTPQVSAAPPPTPAPHSDVTPHPSVPSDSPVSNAHEDDSEGAPNVVQANAKTPSPTATSTITDKPETTLSSPVIVTVTDASSHTSLSVPPVFTSVGVSTLEDGQLVSVTHVIANPTGIWGVSDAPAHTGFFANSKAVAGVFLVVGVLIAGVGVGICLILRRRRRRTPRFLNTISRPLPMPDNPFEDPRDISPPPQMRYASGFTDRTLVIAGTDANRPAARGPFDDDMERASGQGTTSHNSHEHFIGLGLAGIGANGRRTSGGTHTSTESRRRNPSGGSSIGVALTSDHLIDASRRHNRPEPSSASARSSPSLYPPTLPALNNEDTQSLVDIPLSTNNSTSRVTLPSPTANASSTRVSSPTARKPVPPHPDFDAFAPEPESPVRTTPLAPAPRTPQQVQQQLAKPPVLPPRSPLRRNSTTTTATARSLSRSPPPMLKSIQTQLSTPDAENGTGRAIPYEPLTPPASFSSLSPSGSQSGHEPPSPASGSSANASQTGVTNPFSDTNEVVPAPGNPSPVTTTRAGKRDTFYSRMTGQQRRPSVEWRN
ncbi:hypothetical protein C8Q76DRAFT_827875 [Earliella scabrosa]|nr:hypothetical protein C8Q76DRAFT_827875 [Earliella scabrosa]